MVKTVLVNELIADGATLLRELDRQNFAVEAMFWIDFPDQDYWRLVIASPLVRAHGAAAEYRRLGEILRGIDLSGLALEDISLLEPDSQQFRALRSVAETSHRHVYRWTSASLTAELDREISQDRLKQVWEAERKRSNLPKLLFTVEGRRVTVRFHPQHGPLGGIENIKQAVQIALHRPDAFPDCKVNWSD